MDVIRHAVLNEEIGQASHHVIALQPTGRDDRETLPAILIQHDKHPKRLAVIRTILDKVVTPDMVLPGWPKPDTRSVVQPKPSPFGLPTRNLQPLTSPDALDTIRAHLPALQTKQAPDPATAIATIHPGQRDNGLCEICFVISTTLLVALGRTVLTDDATRTAL